MIKMVCALITNDFYKDEKYILSTREDSISLPTWEVETYKDLQNQFKSKVVQECFEDGTMSIGYVNPKFISINDENISTLFEDSDKYLYFLYGCICPKLQTNNNYYWKSFEMLDTNILTELGVINNVISHTI